MTSVPEPDDTPPSLSVGDPVLGKPACSPGNAVPASSGNLMHLTPGRLKGMVDDAVAEGSFVICQDTLPYGNHPDVLPAVCRGFADRYRRWRLQFIARLFGFIEVDPPTASGDDTQQDNQTGGEHRDLDGGGD